jgi:ribosomal-protein-alanine N-acetyltransferase
MRLQTGRLDLFPCSAKVTQAILRDKSDVETLLGVRVPDDWPARDLQELLSFYALQLEADPSLLGWGPWLMIRRAEQAIVGDLGFKGRPDGEGTVEIGYRVVPAYRRQGYAFEATRALVDWALAEQDVRRIIAECSVGNAPSIRILEKLGLQRLETDGSLLRWELGRP